MSTKVGIVGCGNISEIYLRNGRRLADYEVVAVSDIDKQRAQARADEFQIPKVLSIPELLAEQLGPDGMDFRSGGYVMSHAVNSPKPWATT